MRSIMLAWVASIKRRPSLRMVGRYGGRIFEGIIVVNWTAGLFPLSVLERAGVSCDNGVSSLLTGGIENGLTISTTTSRAGRAGVATGRTGLAVGFSMGR